MRYAVVVGFLAALGAGCAQPPVKAETDLPAASTLTVLVHDYAGLPIITLREFEKATAVVLRRTGTQVDWTLCTGREVRTRPALCDGNLEPGRIVLRILGRHPGGQKKYGAPLGSAEVEAGYITLFAAEIQRAAEQNRLPVGAVMAYAAAHEIGHLLLGPEHSPRGIMSATWDKADYHGMGQRSLVFSRAETARMQQGTRSRDEKYYATDLH